MKSILWFIAILCVASFVGCGKSHDNGVSVGQPTIASITPNSVSIGQQNAEATIAGTNLTGASAVNFGDGIVVHNVDVRSASQIVVHYSVVGNAAPGPRTITITTSAGTATAAALFQILNNNVPVAVFTVDPKSGSRNIVITFDASKTTDRNNNIASYHWEFGDGASANGKIVKHKFADVGTFTVKLTVTDSMQGTGLASRQLAISRNTPPIAKFTVRPGAQGNTNTVFIFDASKSVDPASVEAAKIKGYLWDFGDRTHKVRDKAVVEHQFKDAGKFFVSLSVFDNLGQEDSASQSIKVEKSTERLCAGNGGGHQTIIKGRVVAVEPEQWAIVDFGAGNSCENVWHKCDDFRRLSPEGFYGIVDKMTDRGDGVLGVHNSCPYRWPPQVGERVFVYYKTCSQNHCP
jgi:PKD repeat protein